MNLLRFFSFSLLLLFAISGHATVRIGVNALSHGIRGGAPATKKLFVFGDSYADTGNWKKSVGPAWNFPYSMTYPGKPSGRFSDGRVLTDYIASHFGLESPIPYELRNSPGAKLGFGMNFAYGGTAVFKTDVDQPNMTAQIDLFEQVIQQQKFFTKTDVENSIALVSYGGNDYGSHFKNGSQGSIPELTKTVVNQLVLNLKRLRGLGVPKIAFTALEPMGCLPVITTFTSFKSCNQDINNVSLNHNQLLLKNVEDLNRQIQRPVFFSIDLYKAFSSILMQKHGKGQFSGNLEYEDPLKPCCNGVCGRKDGSEAKYTLCKKPGTSFFWDMVHPAQQGWYGVYLNIRSSLSHLL